MSLGFPHQKVGVTWKFHWIKYRASRVTFTLLWIDESIWWLALLFSFMLPFIPSAGSVHQEMTVVLLNQNTNLSSLVLYLMGSWDPKPCSRELKRHRELFLTKDLLLLGKLKCSNDVHFHEALWYNNHTYTKNNHKFWCMIHVGKYTYLIYYFLFCNVICYANEMYFL